MVVFSFKGERLAEHSYLVLRVYCGAFGVAHENLISRRLNLDPKLVSRSLRTACLLHDTGKSLNEFQRNLIRDGGFAFHEVISAYFTYEVLHATLQHIDPVARYLLAFAATYAVLQHHQAMRSLKEVLEKSKESLPLSGGISEEVVSEIELAAQMSANLLDVHDVINVFSEKVHEISRKELNMKLSEFFADFLKLIEGQSPINADEWAKPWNEIQHALPLFTAPLQLSDYLAAYITRGGKLRELHKEALLLLRRAQLTY
jgi:CRISPR-associated endonuclease Cas3-HD